MTNNTICKQHSGLVQMVEDVRDDTGKQWTEINHIKNRPPVWCTTVIALLAGVIGSLLGSIATYAVFFGKLTQAVQAAE